jgi:hypothetical protein
LLRNLRVKAGDNKHALVLTVKGFAAEITVSRDPQAAASDRATAFGTALTREQVEALSDDPDEMRRQLQDMAGPGAAIRVDSFEGQALPPKSQIKAVHITRDMFAAENHMAGGLFIDIITQPGIGPLRGGARFGFFNNALEARNPLVPKKGPSLDQNLMLNMGGSLIKNRSSFSLSVGRSNGYTTPNLYSATLEGRQAQNLDLKVRNENIFASGLIDYAITKDQTLRFSFNANRSNSRNLGVGIYDQLERAYGTHNNSYTFRLQEAGPIGRRFFINSRLLVTWDDTKTTPTLEAPTVVVNDAFTSGGAQRRGGSHRRTFTLMSDLDYVRGIHSLRTGIQVDGHRYRTNEEFNYLGTYTFSGLEQWREKQATIFTRRIGNPLIQYWNVQAGVYVQDDIRIHRTFTISPGVRMEAQTHLRDYNNIGPRFGITYAPRKSGKTTLRGSWGIFYDWLSTGTYEQTLRVDGQHQQELNIANPSYPDPSTAGTIWPTNRYLLGDDLRMVRNMRLSAGLDRQLTKVLRIGFTYSDVRGHGVLVGENLNAPVNHVRPDPTVGNVIRSVSEGRSRSRGLSTNVNLNLSGGGSTGPVIVLNTQTATTGRRFDWRRNLNVMASYYVGKAENNTQGAFSVPASGDLGSEWAPAGSDARHRVSAMLSTGALKNMTANISFSAVSGTPYTITTGYDDNGDGLYNDRPAGVGRNTERARWTYNSYAYFVFTVGFGKRRVPLPPGFTITSSGSGLSLGTTAPQDAPRYRLMFNATAMNLTNHANYIGYSGVMISPFFRQPTAVSGVRQVRLSVGLSF